MGSRFQALADERGNAAATTLAVRRPQPNRRSKFAAPTNEGYRSERPTNMVTPRLPMRKFMAVIMVVATVGVTAVLTTPAAATTFLSDCINNYNICWRSCWNPRTSPTPLPPPEVGYCYAKCDAAHAACVDRAFSASVQGRMRAMRKAYVHPGWLDHVRDTLGREARLLAITTL